MDLGIEVILELFSRKSLEHLFLESKQDNNNLSENAHRIYALREEYLKTIEEVISFLQGKNASLARQICSDNFLPQASRFDQLDELEWAFGSMGIQDQAKYLSTLYLEDLSDYIVECIDPHFGFSRYAERLGRSANSFDEMYAELSKPLSFIDNITLDILNKTLKKTSAQLVCFSVPFPGNLYSAFRCAQWIKHHYPNCKVAMGGGFPNTELRSVSDPRVFDFFDFITLDDGELPIELLAQNVMNPKSVAGTGLKRTFYCENGQVIYDNNSIRADYKQSEVGTPDYSDLLLDRYISVIEIPNPMHSLWSDGRWNKLTMAHGCYWGKCTFCDVSLDYIKLYEPVTANLLVDRMEQLISQTGERGFHFVDEAAPPALMGALALEILKRKLVVTWWTNIRFEKSFTYDLCVLLKASGCIAISGGLEVASDRLLKLIQKGVTIGQVAQVTRNFTESGIMVHAYLMYGYPTQTIQETMDSLEMVRQMFELNILQSGFWHQFALTAHSPVGLNTADYGIIPELKEITFANNDVAFRDKTGIDHDQFSFGLKKSLFNYMHGLHFDLPLQEWFDFSIPKTSIDQDYIYNCLEENQPFEIRPSSKLIWLGNEPTIIPVNSKKETFLMQLRFHDKIESFDLSLEKEKGSWLLELLRKINVEEPMKWTIEKIAAHYESEFDDFEEFFDSQPIRTLRQHGLLIV